MSILDGSFNNHDYLFVMISCASLVFNIFYCQPLRSMVAQNIYIIDIISTYSPHSHRNFAQLARAVEYTDSFSTEGYDSHNECPGYDTKQSDGKVQVILELWGMLSPLSLPSLPGPIWPGVVAPDRVLSTG